MTEQIYLREILKEMRIKLLEYIKTLPHVNEPKELPNRSGIYFWELNGEVIYIGRSVNIRQRNTYRVNFSADRIYYLLNEEFFSSDWMEALMISVISPRGNRRINNRVDFRWWRNEETHQILTDTQP